MIIFLLYDLNSANDEYSSKRKASHDETFPSLFDYDAYDAEVFKFGANAQSNSQ